MRMPTIVRSHLVHTTSSSTKAAKLTSLMSSLLPRFKTSTAPPGPIMFNSSSAEARKPSRWRKSPPPELLPPSLTALDSTSHKLR